MRRLKLDSYKAEEENDRTLVNALLFIFLACATAAFIGAILGVWVSR